MLYTRKEIEKLFSNLVVDYINKGARIDFNNGNYSQSQFDNHIDLIDDKGVRIIIYITTDRAFSRYDCGLCKIMVRVSKPSRNGRGSIYYPKDEEDNFPAYILYQFKNIYTDNIEQYNILVEQEKERFYLQCEMERNKCKVNYNPSLILEIVRKRNGLKRSKRENIVKVEKQNGKYKIYVDTRVEKTGHYDIITIG